MSRKGVTGTDAPSLSRVDSHGFVNRRSSVQSRSPAQHSENCITTEESGDIRARRRAFGAAVAAGRTPVDSSKFGPIDRAVIAEIGRYQALRRRGRADRDRLRAALIPYIQLAGGVA